MKDLDGFMGFLGFLLCVLCVGCANESPQPLTGDDLSLQRNGLQTDDGREFLIDPTAFDEDYAGPIAPADFVVAIDNPYWSLAPGTTFIYEGHTEDGTERIEVNVTDETKVILGVTCTVVRDRVWVDDELVEDTFDWYAQDREGNVWYFGKDSKEISDGQVVSTEGSWEAGINGAIPGIVMKDHPEVGEAYRQEFAEGEAEDMAHVLSLNESVTVPFGSFDNSLQTLEWTPLEPDVVAQKFYAPGVGVILEVVSSVFNLLTCETSDSAKRVIEMKNAKHTLIATVVILGVILLSNALVLVPLGCFFFPEIIFGGHNTAERSNAASHAAELPCQVAESPDRQGSQP